MLDNTLEQTEEAYNLNLADSNYENLLCFLHSDSLNHIYYALIKIERFKTKEDAAIILELLKPDNDSRIREQASEVIKDHMIDNAYRHYYDNEESIKVLINSITDKNPKVCKNITHALQKINNPFQIIEKLIIIIQEQLENFEKEQIKNRDIINIYWSLFTIESLFTFKEKSVNIYESLIETVQKTSNFKEYQIRERSASIVKKLTQNIKNEKLDKLYKQLLNDENFYVRAAIKQAN